MPNQTKPSHPTRNVVPLLQKQIHQLMNQVPPHFVNALLVQKILEHLGRDDLIALGADAELVDLWLAIYDQYWGELGMLWGLFGRR